MADFLLPQRIKNDILIWISLSHENVVPLRGYQWLDPVVPLLVVFDWYSNGNITQYLVKHPEVCKYDLVS